MIKKFLCTLTALMLLVSHSVSANIFQDAQIKPYVSISERYDDNILSAETNELDDFVTKTTVGLNFSHQGKTQNLSIDGELTQEFFAKESDYNNFSQNLRVTFNKEFSKYRRMRVFNSFVHAEDINTFEDSFGRTTGTGRYEYLRNYFAADYTFDLTKRFSLKTKYANDAYNTQEPGESDFLLNAIGLEGIYYFTSDTRGIIEYLFGYHDRDLDGIATTHEANIGVIHYLSPKLHVEAKAGVVFIEDYNDKSSEEPQFSLALINELNDRDTLTIKFDQSNKLNAYSSEKFDAWKVSLNLARQVLRRLRTSLNLFYGDGQYQVSKIDDQTSGASVGLNYELYRDAYVTLDYTYTQVESNILNREYDRNQINLGFKIEF